MTNRLFCCVTLLSLTVDCFIQLHPLLLKLVLIISVIILLLLFFCLESIHNTLSLLVVSAHSCIIIICVLIDYRLNFVLSSNNILPMLFNCFLLHSSVFSFPPCSLMCFCPCLSFSFFNTIYHLLAWVEETHKIIPKLRLSSSTSSCLYL